MSRAQQRAPLRRPSAQRTRGAQREHEAARVDALERDDAAPGKPRAPLLAARLAHQHPARGDAAAASTPVTAIETEADRKRRESANIAAALAAANGRIYGRSGAAELLGMKPTTLASRIRALGIGRRG